MSSYQYIYVMKDLTKAYQAGREVLNNITLAFLPGAKIGVLGYNGAGKSTLLKIMAGLETEFNGEAWAAEGATVGYLPQEPQLDPEKTVAENVLQGLAEQKGYVDRFEEVSMKLGEVEDVAVARRAQRPGGERELVPARSRQPHQLHERVHARAHVLVARLDLHTDHRRSVQGRDVHAHGVAGDDHRGRRPVQRQGLRVLAQR